MISIADSVLRAIGGTPVVRLRRVVSAVDAKVLIKLESVNSTGSDKDRMALAMIEGAEARGLLRPGMRVRVCRQRPPHRACPMALKVHEA